MKKVILSFNKINPAFFVPYISVLIGLNLFKSAWITILLYHFGIILTLILRKNKLYLKGLLFDNKFLSIISLSIFIIPGILSYILRPIAATFSIRDSLAGFGLTGMSLIVFMAYFSIINPVLEEYFWRFDESENILNDFLYAGYHVFVLMHYIKPVYIIVSFIALSAAGVYWRYVTIKHNKYLYVVLTHAMADFSIVLSVLLLLNGEQGGVP